MIVIFSVVILLGGLIWVTTQHDATTNEEASTFLDNRDQVIGFSVQSHEGFSVQITEEGHWIVQDSLLDTNEQYVDEALNRLFKWSGEEVEVRRRDVGLDFPQVSVRLMFEDRADQQLAIGDLNSSGEAYFIEDRSVNQIYLVERQLIEAFPFQHQAFTYNDIFDFQSTDVEEIIIDNGTDIISLTKSSPFPEQETRANVTGWFIHQPYNGYHHTAYSRIVALNEGINQLALTDLVDQNVADLAVYGLDESNFTITFLTEDSEETLIIGHPAANSNYYAYVEGKDDVFTISTNMLEPFSYPADQYRDGYVKILALDVINELSIDYGENNLAFEVSHSEDETSFFADDIQIDEQQFRDAYRYMAGIKVADTVNDAEYSEPETTLTYQLQLDDDNTKDVIVDFVNYDQDHYVVFMDQTSDFLVKKTDVEQMIKEMRSLVP